jgi:hypothetical protein
MAEFRRFRGSGTAPAMCPASAADPPKQERGNKMSGFSHYMKHAMAAAAAIFVSGLLFINSLAVSASEVHSVAGILA